MANKYRSAEDCVRVLDAYKRHGSRHKGAKALDMPRTTFRVILNDALQREMEGKLDKIQMPSFVTEGDNQEPIEDIIDRMEANFQRKQENAENRKWFKIKIKETKPYGLLWFGDPHLDDDGCNWPTLKRHCAIASQPGIYGANIGDTTNNWVGNLMRKYADQETSRTTADRLAEWFMYESGVTWVAWLLGNHDLWNNGRSFYRRLGAKQIPIIDWRAQFVLEHPNKSQCKIDASHGRKGNSIYNDLHGTLREAMMGEVADLYVTGHTHNFAMEMLEVAKRAHICWLLQLRGYKHHDDYALTHGFAECSRGASILAIIDPISGKPIQCFEDVELGAQFLESLRSK